MGKCFIITGGSSGIGEATALEFSKSKEFSKLVLVARNKDKLANVADQCRKINSSIEIFTLSKDLSDLQQCEEAIKESVEMMGSLDGLIGNHGFSQLSPVRDMDIQNFQNMIQLNFISNFVLTKYALPHLEKTKGCIIFNGSLASHRPFEGLSHYGPSKAALNQFAQTVALEEAKNGIRINSVNPGVIVTPIHNYAAFVGNELSPDEMREKLKHMQPTGRPGEPEDIAKLFLFIALDKNMTGSIVNSDAGSSLMMFGKGIPGVF